MSPHLATFTVDGQVLGIEVGQVQEVLRSQARTRVPLAPPQVAGLVNLRGQVLTAIDLRVPLGRPPRADDTEPMVVVVRVAGEPVSLLVDTVGSVVEVHQRDFEPAPGTLTDSTRDLILGAYQLPDRLVLALDVERAVAT
jgi:purine-binding chemotaxis protein CheW